MSKHSKNLPYLIDSRLGDVIGAIQVLGTTVWGSIMPEHWHQYFGNAHSTLNGEWNSVFQQHPEFFLIKKDGAAALKWRHAYLRTYNPQTDIDYAPDQRNLELTPEERDKLHRRPLRAEQISALMNIAIELHARQVAQQQESRWLVPIVASFTGGLLGALLGFVGAIFAARIK